MRLRQVLTNLWKATRSNSTEHGTVTISLNVVEQNGQNVCILFSVRDTGMGIAPENHQRIFSGFTQAKHQQRDDTAGPDSVFPSATRSSP